MLTPLKQPNPEAPKAANYLIMRVLEEGPDKHPSLDEVVRALDGNIKEGPSLGKPFYLAVAAEAKRGSISLIDAEDTPVRFLQSR